MMNGSKKVICFSRTLTGPLHLSKGLVCQDASLIYEDPQDRFCITAVADGHGASSCMRSERGAKIAVETAVECLKEFGKACCDDESLTGKLIDLRTRKRMIRQLTDAMIAVWARGTELDLKKEPLTENELAQAGNYEAVYRLGAYQDRIYGTTLITALKNEDFLLIIQQGDGRCDILWEDGTTECPLPEDARCRGNITTSLSDDDAASNIRSRLIRLEERDIAACILSTDGLDNAFFDDDALITSLQELCRQIREAGDEEERQSRLTAMMENIRATGTGDDLSVAGMVLESDTIIDK